MTVPDTVETPRPGFLKRLWVHSTTDRWANNLSHGVIAGCVVFLFAWLGLTAEQAFTVGVWTYVFNEARDVVEKWPKPDLIDGIPDLIFAAVGAVLAMFVVLIFF